MRREPTRPPLERSKWILSNRINGLLERHGLAVAWPRCCSSMSSDTQSDRTRGLQVFLPLLSGPGKSRPDKGGVLDEPFEDVSTRARRGARRRARRRLAGPGAAHGEEAQHPRHLGRRHRRLQHQRLQPGHDGLQDAEHRPHREARARSSPTGTASRAAPPAARRSSPGSRRSAPASPRSACRARPRA